MLLVVLSDRTCVSSATLQPHSDTAGSHPVQGVGQTGQWLAVGEQARVEVQEPRCMLNPVKTERKESFHHQATSTSAMVIYQPGEQVGLTGAGKHIFLPRCLLEAESLTGVSRIGLGDSAC